MASRTMPPTRYSRCPAAAKRSARGAVGVEQGAEAVGHHLLTTVPAAGRRAAAVRRPQAECASVGEPQNCTLDPARRPCRAAGGSAATGHPRPPPVSSGRAMTVTTEVLEWGQERARAGPWRGDGLVAYLAPLPQAPPPSADFLCRCLDTLAQRGYAEVITSALVGSEQQPFRAVGLRAAGAAAPPRPRPVRPAAGPRPAPTTCAGPTRPTGPRCSTSTPGRSPRSGGSTAADWPRPSWPRRPAASGSPATAAGTTVFGSDVLGYAITGRAGDEGYLQRLAVAPAARRAGVGRALALDGLRWLRRRGARRAVVNTQYGNDAALALYLGLGFTHGAVGPGGAAPGPRAVSPPAAARRATAAVSVVAVLFVLGVGTGGGADRPDRDHGHGPARTPPRPPRVRVADAVGGRRRAVRASGSGSTRPTGPSNLEVAISIYPAVATRSEFAGTLAGQGLRAARHARRPSSPSAPCNAEPNGDMTASGPPGRPRLPARRPPGAGGAARAGRRRPCSTARTPTSSTCRTEQGPQARRVVRPPRPRGRRPAARRHPHPARRRRPGRPGPGHRRRPRPAGGLRADARDGRRPGRQQRQPGGDGAQRAAGGGRRAPALLGGTYVPTSLSGADHGRPRRRGGRPAGPGREPR